MKVRNIGAAGAAKAVRASGKQLMPATTGKKGGKGGGGGDLFSKTRWAFLLLESCKVLLYVYIVYCLLDREGQVCKLKIN